MHRPPCEAEWHRRCLLTMDYIAKIWPITVEKYQPCQCYRVRRQSVYIRACDFLNLLVISEADDKMILLKEVLEAFARP